VSIYINDVCDRCKKSVPIPVEESVMDAKIIEIRKIEAVVNHLKTFLEDQIDPLPEVVVLLRQENGTFMVKALPHLCGPDTSRKRGSQGCRARVEELVHEMFLDVEKKKT